MFKVDNKDNRTTPSFEKVNGDWEVCLLRANETKIATKNAFNQNHSGIESNHESSNDEKTFFE